MDFSSVFTLEDPLNGPSFRAKIGEAATISAPALLRGETSPPSPVSAVWVRGRRQPSDFVWTEQVVPLVSNRVCQLLRRLGITGWSTYDIDLRGKEHEHVGGFHGFVVTGRCGPLDNSRSIVLSSTGNSTVLKGMYFEPSTWDGSDIFTTPGDARWIFVTSATENALRKARVRNALLVPLSEITRRVL
jgi:hypothetical protein